MERLTGPLAQALANHRDACNSKFAAARQRLSTLDATAFSQHLAIMVDPIVRSVAQAFAEKAEAAAIVLYELSLELFATGLLGPASKSPWLVETWRRLLPELGGLIAREPGRVTACMTNGVLNIAATPGTRPQVWIEGLRTVGPHCADLAALVECGKLLAWRAGMAQYRTGAFAAAHGLKPKLVAIALGLPADISDDKAQDFLARLEHDPWLKPEEALSSILEDRRVRVVARVGAFRGFGGPFLRPPMVCSRGGNLIASDGEAAWQIVADACGVVLLRDELPSRGDQQSHVSIDRRGKVSWGGDSASFANLSEAVSQAATKHTLAVTIANSHHVFLLAPAMSGV